MAIEEKQKMLVRRVGFDLGQNAFKVRAQLAAEILAAVNDSEASYYGTFAQEELQVSGIRLTFTFNKLEVKSKIPQTIGPTIMDEAEAALCAAGEQVAKAHHFTFVQEPLRCVIY